MVGGLPTSTVNGFAVDPSDATVMNVAMRDGIFRTDNGGSTWTAVANSPKDVAAIAVNPRNPRELYAARMDGTVIRSLDGGARWSAAQ
jgi:photosystem II stability/assembly factor-like uncharacterized protein